MPLFTFRRPTRRCSTAAAAAYSTAVAVLLPCRSSCVCFCCCTCFRQWCNGIEVLVHVLLCLCLSFQFPCCVDRSVEHRPLSYKSSSHCTTPETTLLPLSLAVVLFRSTVENVVARHSRSRVHKKRQNIGKTSCTASSMRRITRPKNQLKNKPEHLPKSYPGATTLFGTPKTQLR